MQGEVQNDASADADKALQADLLDCGGRLVKRWRLTGEGNELHLDLPERQITVGIYLDPVSGRFYGRVPETDEGALYHAPTLVEIRGLLREALAGLKEGELDTRTWERRIRVYYPNGRDAYGKAPGWRRPQEGGGSAAWEIPGFWSPDPRPWTERGLGSVGPLLISRIERAHRPDREKGAYLAHDIREWEEDYTVRVIRWEQRREPSKTPSKPTRWTYVEHSGGGEIIELPWSQETWGALLELQERIRELDLRVRGFFRGVQGDELVARILASQGRLLTTKGDP